LNAIFIGICANTGEIEQHYKDALDFIYEQIDTETAAGTDNRPEPFNELGKVQGIHGGGLDTGRSELPYLA
jgi:hypothetical protein